MKALVYGGPGKRALEDRPKPELVHPTDAIVKITKTTICGTDLHILKGDVATCHPGRILGHEGVGVVEAVGLGVTSFKPGDRVLISCITACGRCDIAEKVCIRTARRGAGFSATASTERRPNLFAFPMPTPASIRSPREPMKRRW